MKNLILTVFSIVLLFSTNANASSNAVTKAAKIESCVDQWIEAYRKEVGEDRFIKADMIDEWEAVCKEGKNPQNHSFN